MRTDTISRDDIQDIKIEKLNQQMSDRKMIDTEMAKALNAFKDTLSEHVDVNNKNFEIVSESIRALTDNQNNTNAKIEDLDRRVVQLTVILYAVVVAVFVGVIVYAQFFCLDNKQFLFCGELGENMNTLTIIVLAILGFFDLIQILISVALKNIAEVLTIASSGLKTIYKVDEYSQSKPTPTKMRPAPVPAPRRNRDCGAPTKPSKQ